MLVAAWDAVTSKTVVNCFRKSKILSKSQKAAIAEGDGPFKELEEEIKNLHSIELDLVSENMDAASFTNVHAEVLAVQPLPSDAEIVVELLQMEDISNDIEDAIKTEHEPLYCPVNKGAFANY